MGSLELTAIAERLVPKNSAPPGIEEAISRFIVDLLSMCNSTHAGRVMWRAENGPSSALHKTNPGRRDECLRRVRARLAAAGKETYVFRGRWIEGIGDSL